MTSTNGPLIRTRNLVKIYSAGGSQLVALNKVNLTFERGEFQFLCNCAPLAMCKPIPR